MQLVDSVCSHDDYALSRASLLPWLSQVLKELGQLPLAVRLFGEWLHQELQQAALQKIAVDVADLQARWAHEYANDVDEAAGVLGSVIGSRGLRAKVRLALHNLQKLKSCEENEACRQLLGLLALCPPEKVPWSLFDGGVLPLLSDNSSKPRLSHQKSVSSVSLSFKFLSGFFAFCFMIFGIVIFYDEYIPSSGRSIIFLLIACAFVFILHLKRRQNPNPQFDDLGRPFPFTRGQCVIVDGESLEFVSPVHERCQLRFKQEDVHGIVISDLIVGSGLLEVLLDSGHQIRANPEEVPFSSHVADIAIFDGRFRIRLQIPELPATGVECSFIIFIGKRGEKEICKANLAMTF